MNYRNYLISKNKAFENDFFFQKTVNILKHFKKDDSGLFKITDLDLIKLLKIAKENKIKFIRLFNISYTSSSDGDIARLIKEIDFLFSDLKLFDFTIFDVK